MGAGGFAAIGVSAVAMGLPYLDNFLPLGTTPGAVSSSGIIALISFFVGLEVAAAFILIAAGPLLGDRRRVLDAVAIGAAASVAVMLVVIMARTAGGDQVYWFGGFRPARGIAIGIDFEAGSLSAGLASLAAVLVTASMTFSWRYFRRVPPTTTRSC